MVKQKRLVFGAVFSLLGILLLLRTTGNLPTVSALWPVFLIILGLLLLYFNLVRGASERYLLLGMICTLVGIFFLLSKTILCDGVVRLCSFNAGLRFCRIDRVVVPCQDAAGHRFCFSLEHNQHDRC